MTARPWPNRWTRARHAGLSGLVVRPRMGPIGNTAPFDPASGLVVVQHAGWREPFHDEAGEEIREDGVNLGTLSSESARGVTNLSDHLVRGDSPKRYLALTRGRLRMGTVDWRSADGRQVLSWDGGWDRYAAGGTSALLYSRGRSLGGIPDRRISGACLHTDAATGTTWIVAVAWQQPSATGRLNNLYVEEIWMRRWRRLAISETTTDAEIEEKKAAAMEDGLGPAEREARMEALREELRKWIKVAALDTDALLPPPPTGDPKAAPANSDLAPWLFNASGTACQTIRMVIARPGGEAPVDDLEPQSRQRLMVELDYQITAEDVAGHTVHRAAGSIASAQGFSVLSGSYSLSDVQTYIGDYESGSQDRTLAFECDYELTAAVDYAGDNEVLYTISATQAIDTAVSEQWQWTSEGGGSYSRELTTTDTLTVTHQFGATLVSRVTTRADGQSILNDSYSAPAAELSGKAAWRIGTTCLDSESQPTDPDGVHSDTDAAEGLVTRWADLRLGLWHHVLTADSRDWDSSEGGQVSKSAQEVATVDGAHDSLQHDSDADSLSPAGCQSFESELLQEHDIQQSGEVTFQGVPMVNTPSPDRYAAPNGQMRASWNRDADGNVIGSALLGLNFRPYGESAADKPHGHESVYNRYDGSARSIQEMFDIQAVTQDAVFVCYPLRFLGR